MTISSHIQVSPNALHISKFPFIFRFNGIYCHTSFEENRTRNKYIRKWQFLSLSQMRAAFRTEEIVHWNIFTFGHYIIINYTETVYGVATIHRDNAKVKLQNKWWYVHFKCLPDIVVLRALVIRLNILFHFCFPVI